nr:protein FLC EXPRESSOR-like isoform X1 [Ipomoea batatas]
MKTTTIGPLFSGQCCSHSRLTLRRRSGGGGRSGSGSGGGKRGGEGHGGGVKYSMAVVAVERSEAPASAAVRWWGGGELLRTPTPEGRFEQRRCTCKHRRSSSDRIPPHEAQARLRPVAILENGISVQHLHFQTLLFENSIRAEANIRAVAKLAQVKDDI